MLILIIVETGDICIAFIINLNIKISVYKFLCLTDTTFTAKTTGKCQNAKWRNFSMKATGIVRRIDECVILSLRQETKENQGFR